MSDFSIFLIGTAISLLCLAGLILSILEMKRLGGGGGERGLSMAIETGTERTLKVRGPR